MNAFFAQVYHSLFDVEYKKYNKAYVSLSKFQGERDKLNYNYVSGSLKHYVRDVQLRTQYACL